MDACDGSFLERGGNDAAFPSLLLKILHNSWKSGVVAAALQKIMHS